MSKITYEDWKNLNIKELIEKYGLTAVARALMIKSENPEEIVKEMFAAIMDAIKMA